MKKNITITLLLNMLVFANIVANNFLSINGTGTPPNSAKKQSVSSAHYKVIGRPYTLTSTSPVVSVVATSLTCNNSTNGSATVTVTGGVTPYSYMWSNGATTSSINGLMAGVYTCTITDAVASFTTTSVSVLEPTAISTSTAVTNILCNGESSGSATLTVTGGTAPYTYLWSNGAITSSISSLIAGVYTGTVTDANGCTATETASITAPSALSTTVNTTSLVCSNSTNGSATLTVNGGTAPYTYLWSNGAITTSLSSLMAGVYTGTVTDANGCTTIETASITAPSALSTTVNATNLACSNSTNGSATLTVNGGTAPYSYLWNSTPTQTTSNVTLVVGNYSCVITDANGCSFTETVSITSPSALSVTLSTTNLACNTSTAGSATIAVNGGTAPYTYLWNSTPTQTTAMASDLAVGNYSCLVQDANSCTITQTLSITRPTALQATATGTAPICNGLTNGSARVIVSGGTTPYSYSWNTSPVQTTQTATALASGFYTCTVTDNNGCTLTRTVTAYIAPQNIAISANPSSTVCVGTNVTLTASGTRTYTWSNGTTGNSTIVTPTTSVTYTMEGTSVSNCNLIGSITIPTKTVGCVVGVGELEDIELVSVYPNPNNGVLTVKFDENYTVSTIEIFDSYGKIVVENPLLAGQTTINISHLADGIYFYVVKTDNKILERSKLVKQ